MVPAILGTCNKCELNLNQENRKCSCDNTRQDTWIGGGSSGMCALACVCACRVCYSGSGGGERGKALQFPEVWKALT